MACALDGLTVFELGTGPAAAMATMFLGDQCARVVRVVKPGASHLREGGFIVWDRGKACVTLDLDAALEGLDAFDTAQRVGTPTTELLRLMAGADVLVDDFSPSSPLQRLVEWPRLQRLNRRNGFALFHLRRHSAVPDVPDSPPPDLGSGIFESFFKEYVEPSTSAHCSWFVRAPCRQSFSLVIKLTTTGRISFRFRLSQ
jgi:hypothetical protein